MKLSALDLIKCNCIKWHQKTVGWWRKTKIRYEYNLLRCSISLCVTTWYRSFLFTIKTITQTSTSDLKARSWKNFSAPTLEISVIGNNYPLFSSTSFQSCFLQFHALLPFISREKGGRMKQKEKRTDGNGQQYGDCSGEGSIGGLNGNGENTVKM